MPDDARPARARRAGGVDVLARANRQGRGTHETHACGHHTQTNRDHHVHNADTQHRYQRERQKEPRERQEHVDDALDDQVQPTAIKARDRAKWDADQHADTDRGEAHHE